MHNALQRNSVATEQFSRTGRSAIDQTTLKCLTLDHQLYKRKCFAQCSVNFTINYDRIIHTAAALALLRPYKGTLYVPLNPENGAQSKNSLRTIRRNI